jgi:ELWxxDGT repeat protein
MKTLLKTRFLSTYLILLFISMSLTAQERVCNTKTDKEFFEYYDNLLENRPGLKSGQADDFWIHVPLSIQVETNGGTPAISEADIMDNMDTVNNWYAPGKIKFYICGDITYYADGTSAVTNLRTPNIRFHKSSQGCGSTIGNNVGINVNCNRTIKVILGHELGHVLGLGHTHGFNTGTTNELVDGSNCDVTGDNICDTPADPGLYNNVNSSCQYTGGLKDANGDAYQPATDNLMSYSKDKCMNHLTNEQLDRARAIALAEDFTCCLLDEPVVSDAEICSGNTATLSATSSAPEIRWYDAKKDGNLLHTGASYTTDTLVSSSVYYVEAYDTCGSGRTKVTVEVNPPSKPTTVFAELFADMNPSGSSYPLSFTIFKNELFVIANNNELWKTDGTYGNMEKLATLGDNVTKLTVLNDKLLIAINTSTSPELWSSDGTASGTKLVKNFSDTYGYSNFNTVVTEDGMAYMMLNAPGEVAELWKSDGTGPGTQKVKTLSINAFAFHELTPVGNQAFFINEDANGKELWISDGTATGTKMLKDIIAGSNGSDPANLVNSKGFLYFTAIDATTNRGLWVSDGTNSGTQKITDLELPDYGVELTDINGSLYFSGIHPSWGEELFMSDGTAEGTRAMANVNPSGGSSPSNFFSYKDEIYFTADDGINGSELWKLDPNSLTGATMVKNINPSAGSGISDITVANGLIYFKANDGYSAPYHGPELWASDGTEHGTNILSDIKEGTGGSLPGDITYVNNTLFFRATGDGGNELWYLNDPDLNVCKGESITIQTGNPDGEIKWYDSKSNGTLLYTGSAFTTPAITNPTSYYADLTLKGCTSERVEITIGIVNPDPIVSNDTICEGETTTLSVNAPGTVKWYDTSGEDVLLHTGNDFTTGMLMHDTSFFVKVEYDSCTSALKEVKVKVLPKYLLTVDGGSGGGDYMEGAQITVQADVPPANKVFAVWTGDTAYLDDPHFSAATLTMPAKDVTIKAEYCEAVGDLISLTVQNGSGGGTYEIDTKVKIIADEPEEGYVFSHWSGDTAGIANVNEPNTYIQLQSFSQSITAKYTKLTHTEPAKSPTKTLVYPNPVSGILTVQSAMNIYSLRIYDLTGKTVKHSQVNGSRVTMDLSGLDKGIYLLQLQGVNGEVGEVGMHKIIKE